MNSHDSIERPAASRKASATTNDKSLLVGEKQAPAASAYSSAEQPVVNFMSKFRDKDTRALNNLNSQQFIEVWNNYDKDGEST